MAPPPSRRPGFSRRAQYGLFASYVVAVVGMCFGLLLAITARFDPEGHAAVQSALADLTSPVAVAGRRAVAWGAAGVDGIGAYIDAGSKNRALETELRGARAGLIEAKAMARENARLKQLVHLVEPVSGVVATGRLLASTGASTRRYATLSVGSLRGVRTGQPVRAVEGLVGRVVATGQITARVLLITDGGNVVPVRRIGDGMPALATGLGDGTLEVRALEAGSNPFHPGDVLVTSGAGGVYPPGLPVAVIRRTNREAALALPFADPNRLDFAVVGLPYVPPVTGLPPVEGTP